MFSPIPIYRGTITQSFYPFHKLCDFNRIQAALDQDDFLPSCTVPKILQPKLVQVSICILK